MDDDPTQPLRLRGSPAAGRDAAPATGQAVTALVVLVVLLVAFGVVLAVLTAPARVLP